MFTRVFALDLAERVISTAAQAALLVLGADQINALEADWRLVGGFALGGAVLSLLKGVAAGHVGNRNSAGF